MAGSFRGREALLTVASDLLYADAKSVTAVPPTETQQIHIYDLRQISGVLNALTAQGNPEGGIAERPMKTREGRGGTWKEGGDDKSGLCKDDSKQDGIR